MLHHRGPSLRFCLPLDSAVQSCPPWTDCLPRVPHHTSLSFFPLLQGCPLTRAHGAAPSSAPDWSDLDHMLDPQLGVGSTESVGDGSWRSTRAHGSCPTQNQAGQGMDGHSLSTVPPTWQGPSLASPHPAPPPPPRALEFLALPSSEAPMWPALQSTPPHTHTHIQLHQKKTATGIPMAELTEDLETEGLERLEDSWANRK